VVVFDHFSIAMKLAILFSGVYLWLGMLTGVWKYWQIRHSTQARAHYYVDIAHRSSLLYASASLILAVLAEFSMWSEMWNLTFVVINLIFFSASILSYVLHGYFKDTTNQFKVPHQLGNKVLPRAMMTSAMVLLVVGELFATGMLVLGEGLNLF
jgi:hypothetical protein